MPIKTDSLNRKLYDLLKSQGYNPVPKDSEGQTTPVSDEAEVFQMTFNVDGTEYGKVWITIDSSQNMIVYYDDNVTDSDDDSGGRNWTRFLQLLKNWAQRRQLSFELKNQNHLASDMAQRSHMKKKERIAEGYHPMGKSASYNDNIPTVKIVLQHTRQIQEGEQRYRNIAKIFLENQQGERILCPSTKPGIAQIYARHLAEGGLPHDERWNHIGSLVEEYSRMAGFVRATRNGQFNESAQQLVNEGINHYNSLRETLGKMRGHRGYQAYFENYTPNLMETEGDESINELFVQETMDPRIESVMPILARLHKKVNEMSEVSELAEWANHIAEDGEAINPVGIPESAELVESLVAGEITTPEELRNRMIAWQKHLTKPELVQAVGRNPRYMRDLKNAILANAEKNKVDTRLYRNQVEEESELEEDLGPEQKRVGQLGPTGRPAKQGDLVGACESVEEGTYNKDVERAFPGGKASGVKTGASAPKGTSTMPKDKAKAKGKPAGALEESMDPERRQRLDDLIDEFRDSVDPNEYNETRDFEDVLNDIRAEFGDKIADQVDAGARKMHFPRDNHTHGYDPLGWKKTDNRVTKAGKLFKQDSDYLKNTMKSRFALNGKSAVSEDDVEEGIVDKIRAMNYDRLARRSFDKADDEFDKMDDFAFSNVDAREPYEKEFSRHVDKMQSRRNKAAALRGKPQDVEESRLDEISADDMAAAEWYKNPENRAAYKRMAAQRDSDVQTKLGQSWQINYQQRNNLNNAVREYKNAVQDIEHSRMMDKPGFGAGSEPGPGQSANVTDQMGKQIADIVKKAQQGQMSYDQAIAFVNGQTQKLTGKPVTKTTTPVQQGVEEGKFTINAKTGAKLHPKTGAELPPKEKSISKKQMFAPKAKVAAPKLTLSDVWRKVEDVVGQIYPDGDPIDWLLPWFRKQGIADHKVGDILTRAAKKNGYKDIYDYWNSFGEDTGYVAEGTGNFAQAMSTLHGWYRDGSDDPDFEETFYFDDGEGAHYADGIVRHNLETGEITVDFEDKSGEYGGDIKGTFNSIGDAMNALRGGYGGSHGSGKAPNFDTLGNRSPAGPDDLYKTDKKGKLGTLTKGRMDAMKASSPSRMRGGPKGVLPEGQEDLDAILRIIRK